MAEAYDLIGRDYAQVRLPDPEIAARIARAVGPSATVLNVGAGTGSYESCARRVIALEPSSLMVGQRPGGTAPVIQGSAEAMPLGDASFETAMAILTVHHWRDLQAGLDEIRRVARRMVILTFDADVHSRYWLFQDYLGDAMALASTRPPAPAVIAQMVGGGRIEVVPIPATCRDGFTVAYWRRPAAYLDPRIRRGCSSFAELPTDLVEERMAVLAADLAAGRWQAKYHHLLELERYDAGLRLITAGA